MGNLEEKQPEKKRIKRHPVTRPGPTFPFEEDLDGEREVGFEEPTKETTEPPGSTTIERLQKNTRGELGTPTSSLPGQEVRYEDRKTGKVSVTVRSGDYAGRLEDNVYGGRPRISHTVTGPISRPIELVGRPETEDIDPEYEKKLEDLFTAMSNIGINTEPLIKHLYGLDDEKKIQFIKLFLCFLFIAPGNMKVENSVQLRVHVDQNTITQLKNSLRTSVNLKGFFDDLRKHCLRTDIEIILDVSEKLSDNGVFTLSKEEMEKLIKKIKECLSTNSFPSLVDFDYLQQFGTGTPDILKQTERSRR